LQLATGKDLVMVHSAKPGPRTLRLPAPSRVTEVFRNEVVAECAQTVEFTFTEPETVVFRVEY
jgi:hypothetical protein